MAKSDKELFREALKQQANPNADILVKPGVSPWYRAARWLSETFGEPWEEETPQYQPFGFLETVNQATVPGGAGKEARKALWTGAKDFLEETARQPERIIEGMTTPVVRDRYGRVVDYQAPTEPTAAGTTMPPDYAAAAEAAGYAPEQMVDPELDPIGAQASSGAALLADLAMPGPGGADLASFHYGTPKMRESLAEWLAAVRRASKPGSKLRKSVLKLSDAGPQLSHVVRSDADAIGQFFPYGLGSGDYVGKAADFDADVTFAGAGSARQSARNMAKISHVQEIANNKNDINRYLVWAQQETDPNKAKKFLNEAERLTKQNKMLDRRVREMDLRAERQYARIAAESNKELEQAGLAARVTPETRAEAAPVISARIEHQTGDTPIHEMVHAQEMRGMTPGESKTLMETVSSEKFQNALEGMGYAEGWASQPREQLAVYMENLVRGNVLEDGSLWLPGPSGKLREVVTPAQSRELQKALEIDDLSMLRGLLPLFYF